MTSLSAPSVLRRHGSSRVYFDPTNKDHVASLKNFLQTGNWTIQFYAEEPFIEVPMTVFQKYMGHQLGVAVTTFEKEAKRGS